LAVVPPSRAAPEIAGSGRSPLTRKNPTLLEGLRRCSNRRRSPIRCGRCCGCRKAKLDAALRDMEHRVSASRIPQRP
jgi:hypothetical protein